MAKAQEVPGLDREMTFREAAARSVELRAEELFAHSGGVLDTDDIEGVHDMRVASRRLRAVLELFAPCFPKRELRSALKEVKRLADALGERRDPDVAIASLERIGAELSAEDRVGIDSFADELRSRQQGANDGVERALERIEEIGLRRRLQELAAAAHEPAEGHEPAQPQAHELEPARHERAPREPAWHEPGASSQSGEPAEAVS